MQARRVTAAEIDRKLQDDLRRLLKTYGIEPGATDPILAILFRTFAKRIEELYGDMDHMRVELLEELIERLGLHRRRARPAQAVVRFTLENGLEHLGAGAELVGEAESGAMMRFLTDEPVTVSAARIALAATYEDHSLRLVPGLQLPPEIEEFSPVYDPVEVNLGPGPAIFIAVENLPPTHLSRHGFFIELDPEAETVAAALPREAWCLAGEEGQLDASGILRPERRNAGIRRLNWLLRGGPENGGEEGEEQELPALPDGFFAGRCFVMPPVEEAQRFLCRCPKGTEAALTRLFLRGDGLLATRRAWLRISMPLEIRDLHAALTSIWLHTITASNVECLNQTVYFESHGASVPVSKEAGAAKHLVSTLAVFGKSGPYIPETEPASEADAGRYSIHNGRIEITPGLLDGAEDTYANVRLWLTDGAAGNKVGVGRIQRAAGAKGGHVEATSLTSAAGGADLKSDFGDSWSRFAEGVLSRNRIITRADLLAAVRAYDRRVKDMRVGAGLERNETGLQRIQRIRLLLDRDDFVDPDEEARVLRDELSAHLSRRVLYDTELRIESVWQ